MDFSLNDEQQMLQSTARKFAADILTAEAKHIEEHDVPASHALRQKFAEMGFFGDEFTNPLWRGGVGSFRGCIGVRRVGKNFRCRGLSSV